jgi:hypothetical protein
MSNHTADILGSLDGPNQTYPPFDKLIPYPKFLVINIYCGYTIVSGKSICITNLNQMSYAEQLQTALAQIGFHWDIQLHLPEDGRKDVGVQFEIKPLANGADSYEIEIEIYSPDDDFYGDGIISLIANDLSGLSKGANMLTQVMTLAYEECGYEIASLWIRDWDTK